MRGLGNRLKQRIKQLDLNGAQMARRLGLGESRFGQYANDLAEPDLELLIKMAFGMEATPHQLLGLEPMSPLPDPDDPRAVWLAELQRFLPLLSADDLQILVATVKATLRVRHGVGRSGDAADVADGSDGAAADADPA